MWFIDKAIWAISAALSYLKFWEYFQNSAPNLLKLPGSAAPIPDEALPHLFWQIVSYFTHPIESVAVIRQLLEGGVGNAIHNVSTSLIRPIVENVEDCDVLSCEDLPHVGYELTDNVRTLAPYVLLAGVGLVSLYALKKYCLNEHDGRRITLRSPTGYELEFSEDIDPNQLERLMKVMR